MSSVRMNLAELSVENRGHGKTRTDCMFGLMITKNGKLFVCVISMHNIGYLGIQDLVPTMNQKGAIIDTKCNIQQNYHVYDNRVPF